MVEEEEHETEEQFIFDDQLGEGNNGEFITVPPNRAKYHIAHLAPTITPTSVIPFMPNRIREPYTGDKSYNLVLYGHLLDGSKAKVVITNILPSFDALYNEDILKLLAAHNRSPEKVTMHTGKWFIGYNPEEKWIRLYYNNPRDRKNAIETLRQLKIKTANDDKTCYYRKISREHHINLAGWNHIRQYSSYYYDNYGASKCAHVFTIKLENIISFNNPNHTPENQQKIAMLLEKPEYKIPNTLILAWDIETYSSRKTGEVPMAEHTEDNCFMICLSVYYGDTKPLDQFCITTLPINTDSRWKTIKCSSYEELIKMFFIFNNP